MSIYAAKYYNEMAFGGLKKSKRPYKRSVKISLIDIIRKGYIDFCKYSDDLFVSIAQHLMKIGYNRVLIINRKTNLSDWFMDALFSVDASDNAIYLRNKLELFAPIKINDLNFYRNREYMSIEQFKSFSDIKDKILNVAKNEKFQYQPNSQWDNANWILSKTIYVHRNKFYYSIIYGTSPDDSSSWRIAIESNEHENFIDFCCRIYNNYNDVLNGNDKILKHPEHEVIMDYSRF